MVPCQEFPLTEKNLKKGGLNDETINKELENLNQIIMLKEEEIQKLKGTTSSVDNKLNSSIYPSQDKIPIEKLRESYNKLHKAYNTLIKEKEEIMDNLRAETVTNEEQKNYIEILKKNLETKLNKKGSLNPNNNQRSINYESHAFNDDMLQDIAILKSDCENYKKEITSLKSTIRELNDALASANRKNEYLKQDNDNYVKDIEKLRGDLQSSKKDLNNFDSEGNRLIRQYEMVKEEKQSLQNNMDMLTKLNKKLESEVKELYRKNCELEIKMSDLNKIQNRYNEEKSLNQKLKEDYENLLKEKEFIEIERSCYKQRTDEKQYMIDKIDSNNKETIERLEKENREFDKNNQLLIKQNTILEKKVSSLNSEIEKMKTDINDIKIKNEKLIEKIEELTERNEKLNDGIDEIKSDFSNKFDFLDNNIIELEQLNSKLKNKVNELSSENDNLINDIKYFKEEIRVKENEKKKVDKNNVQIEKNMSNLVEKYNELKYSYDNLEKENQFLVNEKERISKEISCLKENCENKLRNKNSELNELYENANKAKYEILNIRDLSSEQAQLIEDLKNDKEHLEEKIMNLESLVKEHKQKDNENKGVSEKLTFYVKKYEEITKEKEELVNESMNKIKQINDLNIKYEKLLKEKINEEENGRELEFTSNKLKEKNKKLQLEVKTLTDTIRDLKENNENQEYLISTLKEKKLNAETINDNIHNKHIELKELYMEVLEEKNKYEGLLSKLTEEAEKSKKIEKENFNKMIQLQNEFNELKLAINTCSSISKISLQKLKVLFDDGNEIKVFSDQFETFYSKFNNYLLKPFNDIQTIKFLEDWIRLTSFELDSFYNTLFKLKEDDNKLKIKINVLEERLQNHEKKCEDTIDINKNLSNKFQEIKLENNTLVDEIEACRKKHENLLLEYRKLDQENKKLKQEIENLTKEIENLNKLKTEMEAELLEKNILEEKYKEIKQNFDLKNFAYDKEKACITSLLQKLAKSYPSKDMIKLVNKLLKNSDELISLEKEKIKIEQKFRKIDQEMYYLDNEDTANIKSGFKNEIDQLKEILRELDDSINEKKEIQLKIENQIEFIEAEERKKYDCIYEYEIKIRHLESQLNETLNNVNIIKHSRNELHADRTTHSFQNDLIKASTVHSDKNNHIQNKRFVVRNHFK